MLTNSTPLQITPIPYGNHVQVIPIGPDAVSTHIPRVPNTEEEGGDEGPVTPKAEAPDSASGEEQNAVF